MLAAIAERYSESVQALLGSALVSVVLYGSVARGEAGVTSDIDLLVVCDGLAEGRFARLRLLEPAEHAVEPMLGDLRARGIHSRVAVIARTPAEAQHIIPLYLDMVEDATLLHDPSGFFAAVLARLRTRLAALGAERRRRGRVRYWVLKRDFVPGEVIEF